MTDQQELENGDSLISISRSLSNLDLSSLINNDIYPEASFSINTLTNRIKDLAVNEEASILSNDNYKIEDFQNRLKQEVLLFEDQVLEDENLSLNDKKLIFGSTSLLYLSLDDIFSVVEIVSIRNGRISNFWKRAANFLLEIAGVTAFAATAFSLFFFGAVKGSALCIDEYCWGTGGLVGAVGGVYLGTLLYQEITRHKYEL
jgi:hypothetical protein